MRLHHIVRAGLVMTLILWAAGVAVAADGSESQDTDAALDAAHLDAVRADLQRQGLSEAEASDLLHQASRDVLTGTKEAPAAGKEVGTDTRGVLVQGPSNLGAPELGGGQGQSLSPQEKALMDKVGTDDARLKELYEKGVPGIERAAGLEHRSGEFESMGRPDLGETRGGFERGTLERPSSGTREAPTHEAPVRELPAREMEQPTREPSREIVERPVYERSTEQPTAEKSKTEMERPPQEAPHY